VSGLIIGLRFQLPSVVEHDVQRATEAKLRVSSELKTMQE